MSQRRAYGFTLIELMVTITLSAILLTIAVPSFQTAINSNRLTSAASEMAASLQVARIEAIRYGRRTVVCLSTNANSATPSCAATNATNATGWVVFVDINTNNTYDSGTDRLLRIGTTHSAVRVLGSSNMLGKVKVLFRSDGMARTSTGTVLTGTIDMCIPTRLPPENVRHINIRGASSAVVRFNSGTNVCSEPSNS